MEVGDKKFTSFVRWIILSKLMVLEEEKTFDHNEYENNFDCARICEQ